jgi:hypothetical protein
VWFGLLGRAIAYSRAIPNTAIKDTQSLEQLVGYLERNRPWIPFYALRRQLGLPNSSNPVERSNNLVTAARQKNHGMSWSTEGSQALTALNTVVCNGYVHAWLKERLIPFRFPEPAVVPPV